MNDYFLQSNFLFLLLNSQGYYLPQYEMANRNDEYGIVPEEFVLQENELAMEDIKTCWNDMPLEEKKRIIALSLERINDERDNLTNMEKGAISVGIELENKEKQK